MEKTSGRRNRGVWAFNDYFGLFTFVPGSGICLSPYGYSYYSPRQVYAVYYPRTPSTGGGFAGGGRALGYGTAPRSMSAGGGVSAGPVAVDSGASTARTAESAAPRSSEGGGRGR
jgi:hypothetical protein